MLLVGKIYQRSGKYEKSLKVFEQLVKQIPEQPGAYYELANAQASLNHFRDAEKSLQQALQINKDFHQAKYALAQLKFRSGNTQSALELARQLIQEKDTAVLGYSLAGDIYMHEKAYRKARQQYDKAAQLEGSKAVVLKIAATYHNEGQSNKAIEVLNDWIARNPNDDSIQMVVAQEFQKMGQINKATQIMNELLNKQPENAVVLNNLAWMYHLQNDPKALEYAERAHKLKPEAGAISDTLGWLLVQSNRQLPRAVQLLRSAVEQTANIPDIKYHLAVALHKTDNDSEARDLLTELVASNRQFSEMDKAKELLDSLQ
jgi:putative PEP-CTERM system TPR-repeat lipoprotein